MNNLAVLENQLKPLAPRLEMVLDKRVPVQRLMQTIMISCERLPKLFECDRQSLFNAAMSAAVLGLEVDGVTGQAYLIPFKGKAQLVVGYKGYNTLAARSGITITGEVVREGDVFDYDLGEGWVKHKPLGSKGRIVGAWAKAAAHGRPPVVKVMSIDELMAVKAKSPGGARSDSPWNDPSIGFPAMCEKTVKRRLARSMPLNVMQLAARMDEALDEQGAATYLTPEQGIVIDMPVREPSPTPTAQELISPRSQNAAEQAASPQPLPPPGEAADEITSEDIAEFDKLLAAAAEKGTAELTVAWRKLPFAAQNALQAAKDRRHKARAKEVDRTLT
jgi:recombination protein RecT